MWPVSFRLAVRRSVKRTREWLAVSRSFLELHGSSSPVGDLNRLEHLNCTGISIGSLVYTPYRNPLYRTVLIVIALNLHGTVGILIINKQQRTQRVAGSLLLRPTKEREMKKKKNSPAGRDLRAPCNRRSLYSTALLQRGAP